MSTQSGFAGYGMKNLVDRSLARLEAQNAQRAQILEDLAVQQTQQAEQAQPEQQFVANEMLNPEGDFARFLASKNKTLNDYLSMPSIQREREYVQPYLDQRWVTHNVPQAIASGLVGKDLERAKENYMRSGRAMAMADFSDRQAEVTNTEKVGSVLNAAARGVAGLADSASGLIKTVAGDGNQVSEYIDSGVKYAKDGLSALNNAKQEELVNYFKVLATNGDITGMAKLAADYPTLFADQLAEQVGPLGAFSKAVGGITKGAGLVKGAIFGSRAADTAAKSTGLMRAVTGGNGTIMAYSGYQMAGGTAQDLSRAGIDPSSEGGVKAVLYAGLGGAAISRLTPATLEKTFMNNLLGRGVPERTARVVSQQELAKLTQGGLFKTPVRYTTGLAKNTLKGATGEGIEEGAQSALEGYVRQMVTDDGRWRDLSVNPWTDKDKEIVTKRAMTGATLGAALGGGMKAGVNTLNSYGDSSTADLVKQNLDYWAQAGQGVFAGPSTKAEGYDPATFDPNTLNKRERALYDFAEENRIKKEQAEAEAKANQQIDDEHSAVFGESNKAVARTDYDNQAKVKNVTDRVEELLTAIDTTNTNLARGIPTNLADLRDAANQFTDPAAKVAKLQEWADILADPAIKAKVGELTQSLINGYEFNSDGTYTNRTQWDNVETNLGAAIIKATGNAVIDPNTEFETVRQLNPEFGKYVDAYKEALSRGYTNTAEQIVKDFDEAVAKWKKNPQQSQQSQQGASTVSDTVKQSRRANGRDVATIAEAIFGSRGWNSKNGRDAYNRDPLMFIEDLADHVATSGRRTLSDQDAQKIITELETLKKAWDNDVDYRLTLPPDLITRLTQVK